MKENEKKLVIRRIEENTKLEFFSKHLVRNHVPKLNSSWEIHGGNYFYSISRDVANIHSDKLVINLEEFIAAILRSV